MHVVILAGGRGTRLKPYTTVIPKPLVPVGEKAILEIMIERLVASGVNEITICVNHMAELIMAFFGDGSKWNCTIHYSIEDRPLGTVGPLKLLKTLPDDFLVMNGDLLTDIDYCAFYQWHLKQGCKLTVSTIKRSTLVDFGVITCSKDRIVSFTEKPQYELMVSMGVYAFNRKLLDSVPADEAFGFDQLMHSMLKSGNEISFYDHKGYWLDIGRPDDYDRANIELDLFSSDNKEKP